MFSSDPGKFKASKITVYNKETLSTPSKASYLIVVLVPFPLSPVSILLEIVVKSET